MTARKKLPRPTKAWAVVREDGRILLQTLWLDRIGGLGWARSIDGSLIRVRIVPVRARRAKGKKR